MMRNLTLNGHIADNQITFYNESSDVTMTGILEKKKRLLSLVHFRTIQLMKSHLFK